MSAHLEIHPVKGDDLTHGARLRARIVPPSGLPHYLREVAANGQTVWHSEAYATRANARRAARRYDLPVWEFDAAGVRVK